MGHRPFFFNLRTPRVPSIMQEPGVRGLTLLQFRIIVLENIIPSFH
jgi:hypothetical protein